MNKRENLEGQRFGRLVVLEDTGKNNACKSALWLCRCDCGTLTTVAASCLKRKGRGVRSCGCLQREASKRSGYKRAQAHGADGAFATPIERMIENGYDPDDFGFLNE